MCCRTDIDCAVAYYGTYIEHRIKEAKNLHRPFMRRRNIGWRLDYVLASQSIAGRAQSCKVLADFGTSDHAPVVTTL